MSDATRLAVEEEPRGRALSSHATMLSYAQGRVGHWRRFARCPGMHLGKCEGSLCLRTPEFFFGLILVTRIAQPLLLLELESMKLVARATRGDQHANLKHFWASGLTRSNNLDQQHCSPRQGEGEYKPQNADLLSWRNRASLVFHARDWLTSPSHIEEDYVLKRFSLSFLSGLL